MTNLVKSTTSSLVEVVNDLIDENVGMDGGIPFREAWADLLRSQSSVVCDVINNEGAMYSKFFVSTLITVISVGTGGAALLVPTTLLALASAGLAGSGWHFFNAVQLPKKARSQFLIDAFRSASVEEWEHLFLASGSVNLFAQAIEAGVVMQSESQNIYSGAAKYIKSSGGDVDVPVSYPSREAVTAICKVLLAKYHGSRYEELKDLLDKDILLNIEDCSYLSKNATMLPRELRMARVREVDYALFKDWVANVTPIATREIGSATKLNAIPVSVIAEDVITTHTNAEVQVAARPTMAQSRILCPIQLLAEEPFRSTAMLGGQRSGKTYIVALHTQNMKKTRKTVIFYVNLFDATYDAADDWTHADFVITAHIKKLTQKDAQAVIEKVGRLIKQFSDTFNAIFVFDEWAAFTSKANAWGKKAAMEQQEAKAMGAIDKTFYEPQGIGTSAIELMNICMGEAGELASIGKKQFKALWLIAPFMKAGDVEQQGLVMKSLHPMMVAIPPGRSITWTRVVEGENFDQQISFDSSGYIASMPNFAIPRVEDVPQMQCDRMIYLKGCWHSLDTLPTLDKTPVVRDAVEVTAIVESIASPIETPMSEVEVTAIVDTKPDGIEEFPLVDYLWQYLDGKEARNLKQISDAFRKSNTISEADLKRRMGTIPNYKDGIHNVLLFGVKKGFINQVSPDVFGAVKRH